MTGSTATVYEFDIPAEPETPLPTVQFRISGELFTMRQPKLTIAIGLLKYVDAEFASMSTMAAGLDLAQALWGLVAYVQEEPREPLVIGTDEHPLPNPRAGKLRGQARLLQRLNDSKDAMDVLDLAPIFERIVKAMFDRPTGPSPASSPVPADGGHDSGAGSSAAQAAIPGT